MKVIDIMQKVANKEIFKFRIDDVNYYVDKSNYICKEGGNVAGWMIDDEWLNRNAEVIEEDKKIEKIEYSIDKDGYLSVNDFREHLLQIINKINEIIDYITKNK